MCLCVKAFIVILIQTGICFYYSKNIYFNKEFEYGMKMKNEWVVKYCACILGISCFIDKRHKYEICLNN